MPPRDLLRNLIESVYAAGAPQVAPRSETTPGVSYGSSGKPMAGHSMPSPLRRELLAAAAHVVRICPARLPRRAAERPFASRWVAGCGQPPKRSSESPRSLWGPLGGALRPLELSPSVIWRNMLLATAASAVRCVLLSFNCDASSFRIVALASLFSPFLTRLAFGWQSASSSTPKSSCASRFTLKAHHLLHEAGARRFTWAATPPLFSTKLGTIAHIGPNP
jgi:hypothetical protein